MYASKYTARAVVLELIMIIIEHAADSYSMLPGRITQSLWSEALARSCTVHVILVYVIKSRDFISVW